MHQSMSVDLTFIFPSPRFLLSKKKHRKMAKNRITKSTQILRAICTMAWVRMQTSPYAQSPDYITRFMSDPDVQCSIKNITPQMSRSLLRHWTPIAIDTRAAIHCIQQHYSSLDDSQALRMLTRSPDDNVVVRMDVIPGAGLGLMAIRPINKHSKICPLSTQAHYRTLTCPSDPLPRNAVHMSRSSYALTTDVPDRTLGSYANCAYRTQLDKSTSRHLRNNASISVDSVRKISSLRASVAILAGDYIYVNYGNTYGNPRPPHSNIDRINHLKKRLLRANNQSSSLLRPNARKRRQHLRLTSLLVRHSITPPPPHTSTLK